MKIQTKKARAARDIYLAGYPRRIQKPDTGYPLKYKCPIKY
jgi:hypothetical protein